MSGDFVAASAPYVEEVFRKSVDQELERRERAGRPVLNRDELLATLDELKFEQFATRRMSQAFYWPHRADIFRANFKLDLPEGGFARDAFTWVNRHAKTSPAQDWKQSASGLLRTVTRTAQTVTGSPLTDAAWTSEMNSLRDEYMELYKQMMELEAELERLEPNAHKRADMRNRLGKPKLPDSSAQAV